MAENSDCYCLKCKKQTGTLNPKLAQAKNGRRMMKGACSACGCNKSRFISETKEGGFLWLLPKLLGAGMQLPGTHGRGRKKKSGKLT